MLGDMKGLWRYRIGNYRVICTIEDELMVIVAVTVGH
jgi:mRNA interferase RelE/StbE